MYDCPEMALEPPERPTVGVCAACGGEILRGELAAAGGGDVLHDDRECLLAYAGDCWSESLRLTLLAALGLREEAV